MFIGFLPVIKFTNMCLNSIHICIGLHYAISVSVVFSCIWALTALKPWIRAPCIWVAVLVLARPVVVARHVVGVPCKPAPSLLPE
jgi:hypothetical protein